jgi:hypothetical protein
MNYEDDIKIDRENLDGEFLKQPQLVFQYCKLEADAIQERDKLKEELKITEAALFEKIQNSGEKITVSATQAKVDMSDERVKVVAKLIGAEHNLNILQGVIKAFDHRKSALENLVQLWMRDYFSTPKNPKGTDNLQENQRAGLKRKE